MAAGVLVSGPFIQQHRRALGVLPCRRQGSRTQTFSSLADLLPECTAPERLHLEAKLASPMSYGFTVKLLEEVLLLDGTLNTMTRRTHHQAVAQRCEDDLRDVQAMFVEECERDWVKLKHNPAIRGSVS